MDRRRFLRTVASCSAGWPLSFASTRGLRAAEEARVARAGHGELGADLVVLGGGLGGCAAALAAARDGLRVILTEETDWIGGQLTSQGVPPDEHPWIESFGAPRSYREFRTLVRDYYRNHYPLTAAARGRWNLNPGSGHVSRLCHEPRVALAVFEGLLAPFLSSGRVRLLLEHRPTGAEVDGDVVRAVQVLGQRSGRAVVLRAPYFIDSTELGDVLPLVGAEYVTGAESQRETGEPHAPREAAPANHQAFTHCFALDHVAGRDAVIERPRDYEFWRDYAPKMTPAWTGRLLSYTGTHPYSLKPRTLFFDPVGERTAGRFGLWVYRRIVNKDNFVDGAYDGDVSLINWPQNDYLLGNLVDVADDEKAHHIEGGKQLSLSLLYWLQTEAPRPDGGTGFPGLGLRGDVFGTEDGLAKAPYVREARRIRALFTVVEQHVSTDARMKETGKPREEVTATPFGDSVGVGSYRLDLHPSTGGDNYIDTSSLPFQIPLGALVPQRVRNLIAGAKNIGVTHLSNGCYRLHPVEWNIGEAAGTLAAYALRCGEIPRAIREHASLFEGLQKQLHRHGVETYWPKTRPL